MGATIKIEQSASRPKPVFIYEENNDFGGKWTKNTFPKTCYAKMVQKVGNIIERNMKITSLKKDLSKYKLSQISAFKYRTPAGQLGLHCDSNPSVAFLFSIGCTCNFYVFGASMQHNKDKQSVNKFKDGQTFKFKSGDMLFFDASHEANIIHGVMGIDDSSSCPTILKEKCKGIEEYRISCQLRAW